MLLVSISPVSTVHVTGDRWTIERRKKYIVKCFVVRQPEKHRRGTGTTYKSHSLSPEEAHTMDC
jgi:hypothetical protein